MSPEEIPVIVLEDSMDEQDNMRLLFKEDGKMGPVEFFANSVPFLNRVRELKYAVLVLDYKLSEGPTGMDVLLELQEDDEDECFYSVVNTGYPSVPMMLGFIKLRPNDFVIKGDGEEHYREQMAAIRKGRHKIVKRIEREEKRNALTKQLLAMAEAFTKPMNANDTARQS